MKPNDDIVGQTITNISENFVYLSNGMKLYIGGFMTVVDAKTSTPLKHWRTIENEKRIRTPEATK